MQWYQGPEMGFEGSLSRRAYKDWGCCCQRQRCTGVGYKDECPLECVSLSCQLGSSQHRPELLHEQGRMNSEGVWPQG